MRVTVSYLIALIALTIACWLVAVLLWGFQGPTLDITRLVWLVLIGLLLGSALVLAARRLNAGVWISAGLFLLLLLSLPGSTIIDLFQSRGDVPFGYPESFTLNLIASLAFVVAALLLYSGLSLYLEWQRAGAGEGGASRGQRWHAVWSVFALLLGVLLLARALQGIYWLVVWDATYDSFVQFVLFFPLLAVICSGLILAAILPFRLKWFGFGFSLIISAVIIAVSARAQRVDFRRLTEERAGRVSQAVESYYSREGRYPQSLRQLIPRDALWLPGPVIVYGQGWCYDGGGDGYRLGYVYRRHWSDPRLSGRVYKMKGEAPAPHPVCEREVSAIQERYPEYPFSYWVDGE